MRALKAREKRMLAYLGILLAIVAWDTARRHWSANLVQETEHYMIHSTATPQQTAEIGRAAEIVYAGYRRPYCYQYYGSNEPHPYHWMMHEATHQRNAEAARLALPQWLDEGLACYVSTSRIVDGTLALGQIDTNTYPVWWIALFARGGDLDLARRKGTVISLRTIISGAGGPTGSPWLHNPKHRNRPHDPPPSRRRRRAPGLPRLPPRRPEDPGATGSISIARECSRHRLSDPWRFLLFLVRLRDLETRPVPITGIGRSCRAVWLPLGLAARKCYRVEPTS